MDGGRQLHDAGLLPRLQATLCGVLAGEPGVRWAYLIGSSAAGAAFHDVDVAVLGGPSLRGTALGRLAARIEEALGAISPALPLDLVDLGAATMAMRAEAVYHGRLLVNREPEARRDWEVDTVRRWLDLRPWLQRSEQLRMAAFLGRSR